MCWYSEPLAGANHHPGYKIQETLQLKQEFFADQLSTKSMELIKLTSLEVCYLILLTFLLFVDFDIL